MIYPVNKKILEKYSNDISLFLCSTTEFFLLPAYIDRISFSLDDSMEEIIVKIANTRKNIFDFSGSIFEEHSISELERNLKLRFIVSENYQIARIEYIKYLVNHSFKNDIDEFKKNISDIIEKTSCVGFARDYTRKGIILLTDNYRESFFKIDDYIQLYEGFCKNNFYRDFCDEILDNFSEIEEKYFPHVNAIYYDKHSYSVNFKNFNITLESPSVAIFSNKNNFKRFIILDSSSIDGGIDAPHTYLDELEDAGISYEKLLEDIQDNDYDVEDNDIQGVIIYNIGYSDEVIILTGGKTVKVDKKDIRNILHISKVLESVKEDFLNIVGPSFNIYIKKNTLINNFSINKDKCLIYYDDGTINDAKNYMDFEGFNLSLNEICDYSFPYIYRRLEEILGKDTLANAILAGEIK